MSQQGRRVAAAAGEAPSLPLVPVPLPSESALACPSLGCPSVLSFCLSVTLSDRRPPAVARRAEPGGPEDASGPLWPHDSL